MRTRLAEMVLAQPLAAMSASTFTQHNCWPCCLLHMHIRNQQPLKASVLQL
jgi:hypothetical protein